MFNFIVSYNKWQENAGKISRSRIYLSDIEKIKKQFTSTDGLTCYESLRKLPTLLMEEIYGSEPKFAKVVSIKSIEQDDRFVNFEYSVDHDIPTITNIEFGDLSGRYSLNRWSLDHTHWEVIDFDLYRLLLITNHAKRFSPTVFSFENVGPVQVGLVSVMMPFSAEFTPVYDLLREVAKSIDLEARRADDIWENQVVINDIVSLIARSRVVICDCTRRNPNVFYEAGIAHAIGKEVVLITQNRNDIPFNLRHLRYVEYLNNVEGLKKLGDEVKNRLNTILRLLP